MKFLFRLRRRSKSSRQPRSQSNSQPTSQCEPQPQSQAEPQLSSKTPKSPDGPKSPRTPISASTPRNSTYSKHIKYSSPRTPRAATATSSSTQTTTTDATPPPPPLEPRYTTKINLARCSSLESMDTMKAALYLRPSQLGQYDIECPETPRRPKQKSPPRPVLVRTFGPTVLRSNRQYQKQMMQRRSKSEKAQLRRSTPTQPTRSRPPSMLMVPNAAVQAAAVAVAGFATQGPKEEVPVPGDTVAVAVVDHDSTMPMMDKDDVAPPSPVPSNLITPLDLNPADECTGYFPDTSGRQSAVAHAIADNDHRGTTVPNTVDQPQSVKQSGTTNALIALLPSLPTFYPTSSSPIASPTGSTSRGGDTGPISPTFSNFKFGADHGPSVNSLRSWDSVFGQSKVVRTRSITIGVDSTPLWNPGNVFGESVVLRSSPASDVPLSPSVYRSSRPTSIRLAENRPIVLDMSTARRRPRQITVPCVPPLSPTTISSTSAVFKDTTRSFTSPMSPATKGSLSGAQDSKVIASLMEQLAIDSQTEK